jgi:transposase-like protein
MEAVTILTFNESEHAEAICKQLEQAGLHPVINDERKRQKHWLVTECLACFRVQVDKRECEPAERLLDEWSTLHPEWLREAVHCPECGSSQVEYPQFNRKFTLEPAVYALLTKVGLFEKKFYCHHCHYMWPTIEKLDAHTDILGWPEKRARTAPTPPTAGVR